MDIDRNNLRKLSQERTEEYLHRTSLIYLECCVSLMLTHLSSNQVADILEKEAQMIRDFD
ncbi:hypothetical protein [Aquamicrobium soli]|uniref:Uncharacterized protein n=1 Tax=Aquamicrobium soli TaxID=1811518 RepID=A0ABV7K5M9_9HYPH